MNGFETVIFEKKDGIARITLNRPDRLNAYNIRMRDDLYDVLRAVKDDSEIRVGIIRGAGEKAFCAGADLTEFLTAPPPVMARQVRWQRDLWGLFLSVPQPLIAAVHGYVLGSGIEMSLCCDIRLAAENAKFGMPEVGLGILPAAGGTQTLPRLVGRGKALEILLADKRLDAREAYEIGLVNQVLPNDKLMECAEQMAKKIASFDPFAVRFAKRAITEGLDMTFAHGLELEQRLACELSARKQKTK